MQHVGRQRAKTQVRACLKFKCSFCSSSWKSKFLIFSNYTYYEISLQRSVLICIHLTVFTFTETISLRFYVQRRLHAKHVEILFPIYEFSEEFHGKNYLLKSRYKEIRLNVIRSGNHYKKQRDIEQYILD